MILRGLILVATNSLTRFCCNEEDRTTAWFVVHTITPCRSFILSICFSHLCLSHRSSTSKNATYRVHTLCKPKRMCKESLSCFLKGHAFTLYSLPHLGQTTSRSFDSAINLSANSRAFFSTSAASTVEATISGEKFGLNPDVGIPNSI